MKVITKIYFSKLCVAVLSLFLISDYFYNWLSERWLKSFSGEMFTVQEMGQFPVDKSRMMHAELLNKTTDNRTMEIKIESKSWAKLSKEQKGFVRLDNQRLGKCNKKAAGVRLTDWDGWKCNNCFPNDFSYDIESSHACQLVNGVKIELLFIIQTTAENRANRQNLRDTWLTVTRNNTGNVRYIFLIGKLKSEKSKTNINHENEIYGDIVQTNVQDSYITLPLKTIAGLRWSSTFCSSAERVIKTDDDMWINTRLLIPMLRKIPIEHFVGGACLPQVEPVRKKTGFLGKFYVNEKQFPYKYYPPYCQGLGILLSMDVVQRVLQVSKDIPFFQYENVYLGLCFARIRQRVNCLPGFLDDYYDIYVKYRNMTICDMDSGRYVTVHDVPSDILKNAWTANCTIS